MWWIGSLLAAAGLAASGDLLARTFALLASGAQPGFDLCSRLFAASCDAALTDEHSRVLGIPLAGWGVVHFSALGALLGLARFVEGRFEAEALVAASVLALAGAAAGVTLALGSWLGGTPICPLCVSVHASNLALFVVLQCAIARPPRAQLALARTAWTGLVRRDMRAPEAARWSFVGFGCVALVAAVAWQWVLVECALRLPRSVTPHDRAAAIAAYVATPRRTLPVDAADPHQGPLGAPVELVVFESLQCPHCQRFAPVLSRLEREFGDRLLVVFKHYPLSTRCNERLGVDMQPDACEIAWAAEAARRQSRFWQFHDAMLAAGPGVTARDIEPAAQAAGLDLSRFAAERQSAPVRERVAADVELGNELGLPGTPAAYLDGRLVRPVSAELLEILIRHQLERDLSRSAPAGRATRSPVGAVSAAGP